MIERDIKMHVMSVSMRKALIIWEEYIGAKSRNEALFLRSVSIKLGIHGPPDPTWSEIFKIFLVLQNFLGPVRFWSILDHGSLYQMKFLNCHYKMAA